MNKKCQGCGAIMQSENPQKEGYIEQSLYENSVLCERCFRIRNYNEYRVVIKDNQEFIDILTQINKTKSLVVLVLDVLNLPKDLHMIKEQLNNDILLVLTKRDLLPRSVQDYKLLYYLDHYQIPFVDRLVVSSTKSYQFDELIDAIRRHKTGKNVYMVGFTNAGKSTMINQLMYHYAEISFEITTSMLPSTTIDLIEIAFDETLMIVDTPGLLEENSLIHFVPPQMLKKIAPKREIKPITYQIKGKQAILIEDFFALETEKSNSLTFYVSNQLKIERVYKKVETSLEKHILQVPEHSDVVISGLGFIKVVHSCELVIYVPARVAVFIRPMLIG